VRRSIVTMFVALVGLSTSLVGQRQDGGDGGEVRWSRGGGGSGGSGGSGGALMVGLAGTLGGGWQIEALDVGYARAVRAGPIAALSLTARLGSFIDEGAIIGGARGFVFGTTFAVRTPTATIAELGADTSSSRVGFDLTVEATGYVGSHSPLPVGSPWGAVSVLPGLRFGDPNGARFGLLLGPTVFLGDVNQVRTFLGARFETPLARRERHP
jgi:hypothetical protein